MAYSATGLMLVAGSKAGNAPQMWTYQSADAIGDIDGAGYFNDASSILKVGDLIYVYSSVGGSAAYGFVVVNSNSSGVVDVSSVTAIGATDSD
jgi:hypothetical protein